MKDVRLFITRESWTQDGGEHQRTSHKLCVLISRPCVIGHKPTAVVAAIEKMADNVPRDVETFDDILDFLTDLRDVPDAPDVFYLGQIPGFAGRFGARLDSLHTVQVPKDEAAMRQFIDQKRIGRLNSNFARDFHTRVFAPSRRLASTITAGCPRKISAGLSPEVAKRCMTPDPRCNRPKQPSTVPRRRASEMKRNRGNWKKPFPRLSECWMDC